MLSHVAMIKWTENLTERLRLLWNDGASSGVIAALLGVSRDAVTGKARRMSLQNRDTPIMTIKDKFAERLAHGDSVEQAGLAVGVKKTKAKQLLAEIRAELGRQAV